MALPAGDHYQRGYHPTATCGVFGAAAAAARVFGLDAAGVESALGIALSQSAGSLQFLVNGAWTKRFQVGWAAMAGLTAATLAREGFKGATDALDGRHGFLSTYAPNPNPPRAVQDLGTRVRADGDRGEALPVLPLRPCRNRRGAGLRAEHGFDPAAVERITYGTSAAGMLLVGAPADKKADPQNVVDGQFSGPFVLSAALATGRMDWDSYAGLQDPAIRSLLPRVVCEPDPEIEAEFPANMSGKVTDPGRWPVLHAHGGGAEGRAGQLPDARTSCGRSSPG